MQEQNPDVQMEAALMSTFALGALLLCIPPLAAHIKANNLAATLLVFGVATVNFQNFINPLIWHTNDLEKWWNGKGLCDIETKISIGFGIAIVGATASIFRQLASILDFNQISMGSNHSQRRRRIIYEVWFCVVMPIYAMSVHYIVQPERYWIVTIIGCTPSFDRSWPTYVLIFIWPIVICIVGSWYCSLAVIRLIKYRRQMSSILSSRSSMTKSRFIRLFILAMGLLVAYFPLAIYTFVRNLGYPLLKYSWTRVHVPDWSLRIHKEPINGSVGSFDRWIQVGTGYALFLFFGLGHDAVAMYKAWWIKIGLKRLFNRLKRSYGTPRKASSGRYPLITRQSHTDTNTGLSPA